MLLTLLVTGAIFVYFNKGTTLHSVTSSEVSNNNLFAIYVSTDGENYSASYDYEDSWPTENYTFAKAECYDSNNNLIDSSSFEYDNENHKLRIYTTSFTSCKVYFDYNDPCNDTSITVTNLKLAYDRYCTLDNAVENNGLDEIDYLWDSTLDGDGYRYISEITTSYETRSVSGSSTFCAYSDGSTEQQVLNENYQKVCPSKTIDGSETDGEEVTVTGGDTYTATVYSADDVDNYICFGTTSSSTCLNNTSRYLYRIIGIFEGSDGSWYLKLIKSEPLSSTYALDTSSEATDWSETTLYTSLNGSAYYVSSSYVSSTLWRNLIETWDWKLLDSGYRAYGHEQAKTCEEEVDTENGKQTIEVDCAEFVYSAVSGTTSYAKMKGLAMYSNESSQTATISAKVGLMYPADYLFSLGSTGLTSTSSNALYTYSWLYSGKNEWLIARDGYAYVGSESNMVYSYFSMITSGGRFGSVSTTTTKYYVRPVIYLKTGATITSGDGSESSPYILSTTVS